MGMKEEPNISAAARSHETSRPTILRATRSAAATCLVAQSAMLRGETANIKARHPDWALVLPMSDSTTETVQLMIGKNKVKAPFHLHVQIITVAYGYDSGESYEFCFITPPIPTVGTSARQTREAETCHPFTQEIHAFTELLLSLAKHSSWEIPCEDSASSNAKRCRYKKQIAPEAVCVSDLPCFNHQNFIGIGSVNLAVHGPTLVTDQYCSAKFMNRGQHLLRCAMTCRQCIDKVLILEPGKTDEVDNAFREEFVSYVTKWYKCEDKESRTKNKDKQGRAAAKATGRPMNAFLRCLHTYFELVSSGFGIGSKKIVVRTNAPLTPELRAEVVDEISAAVVGMLFQRQFEVPSVSKWTKQGPCADRFIAASVSGNLERICDEALGKLSFDVSETSYNLFEMDHQFTWNKASGKLQARHKQYVGNHNKQMGVAISAFGQEGQRYLTVYHLKLAHSKVVPCAGREPAIALLVNDKTSVIYQILCYTSSLMKGKGRRILILVGLRGCRTAKEWAMSYPEDVRKFRQTLSGGAAVLERRQRRRLKLWPWPLFAMLDSRISLSQCEDISTLFLATPQHRLESGGAEKLHKAAWLIEPEAETSARRIEFVITNIKRLKPGSHRIKASVAQCEDLHASHRQSIGHAKQTPHISTVAGKSCRLQFNRLRRGNMLMLRDDNEAQTPFSPGPNHTSAKALRPCA